MFKNLKLIFSPKNKDIRKRLGFTLLCLFIFIVGTTIPVPGVTSLKNVDFGDLANAITGGSLKQFSIFALGVMPYISATIITSLLQMDILPYFTELKESGAAGRQKINQINRYLGIIIAFIEGFAMSFALVKDATAIDYLRITVILTAGTAFLLWLGDQITNKGIGNGISMIIFVGIISGLPSAVTMIWNLIFGTRAFSTAGLLTSLCIIVGAIVLIAGVVFVQQAERRIPVQYAKKVVGRKMVGAQNTHIPLKLAMAGVMPIIFASSFMTFPAMIIQMFVPNIANETGFWSAIYKFSIATSTSAVPVGYTIANAIVYLLLILGFTFFYTYATFNPAEVANNIKKNGGFIPGIRAGKPTTDYLSSVLSKLLWFGGLFLAVIAILPMLVRFIPNVNLAFGGTSILIVVGVALEMVQQLESLLVMRHYKGFLD